MTASFQPDSHFTPTPDITTRILEGEAVFLNIRTGAYFGLNKAGTYIWQLYSEGKTLAEAVAGVCQRFQVEPDRAELDVCNLTERLLERGLLQLA